MILPILTGFLALLCLSIAHPHHDPYDHGSKHGSGHKIDPLQIISGTTTLHAAATTLDTIKANAKMILDRLGNKSYITGRSEPFDLSKVDEFRNQLDVALSLSQVILDDLATRGSSMSAPKMLEYMPGQSPPGSSGTYAPVQDEPGLAGAQIHVSHPPGYGPHTSYRSPYHLPPVEIFKRLVDLNADVQLLLTNIKENSRHSSVSLIAQNLSPQMQILYNKYGDRKNKEMYTENDTEKAIKLVNDVQTVLMGRMREDFSGYARQLIDDDRMMPLIQAQLNEMDRLEGLLIVKLNDLAEIREKQKNDGPSYQMRKKVDEAGAMALLFFDYVKIINGEVQIDWKPIRYSFYGDELEKLFNEGTGEPLDEAIRVAQKVIDQLHKSYSDGKNFVERNGEMAKENPIKYHSLQFWQFQITNRLTEFEALKNGYHSHHMNMHHQPMYSPYGPGYGTGGYNATHQTTHGHHRHHY
ncbi:hypothetical protein Ddc_13106 [Ditylenchus destructor]|nr:hypothetical protein Ddc_13106 [Ditylenchus destructor]